MRPQAHLLSANDRQLLGVDYGDGIAPACICPLGVQEPPRTSDSRRSANELLESLQERYLRWVDLPARLQQREPTRTVDLGKFLDPA